GYDRKELFPHSDVDLLFLHAEEEWDEASKIAEFILYMLWDLGIQVGQAVRTVDEALELAGQDATVSTNLLDARVVCGNRKLFQRFSSRFWEEVAHEGTILSYVEAKLDERNLRHTRCGDSRYVLEPNIKDGKGGLRDLHTLYWLARYVYRVRRIRELVERGVLSQEEYRAYKRAQKFLGLVRTHLHLESGRAEERLTFDMQRVLAEKLGYHDRGNMLAVERFMKAYFLTAKSVGNLTRVFCSVLEDERKHKRRVPFSGLFTGRHKLQGFVLEGGRVAVPDSDFFDEHPPRLISLFAVAQEHDLDIHPQTLRLVSRKLGLIDKAFRNNPEANALFVDILTSPKQPDVALRRMNEAGVLGRFIRDFGRIVGQMQFDTYHVYTVDEHTIFAIGILSQIASGKHRDTFPLASRLIEQIASKRALYLAVFCHDISKGQGGDHSTLGERVARKLAKRFGFDPEEVETAAWLVRLHLLFSHTAFKRDIAEDKTIAD
ncbi:MAG: [protein-PII] uridylyltransferase, partial [Rickettsiales bacterium]